MHQFKDRLTKILVKFSVKRLPPVGYANDLYYQTLEISTPNALEVFQSAGLVGYMDTDPAVPYQAVIQEYLAHKQKRNQK